MRRNGNESSRNTQAEHRMTNQTIKMKGVYSMSNSAGWLLAESLLTQTR